jgi:hypothetical protein
MKKIVVTLLAFAFYQNSYSQGVGIGTTTPEASAQLHVQSSDKGFLLPRMNSTQRNFIPSPATGLMVFDTDKGAIFMYDGIKWLPLGPSNNNLLIQPRTSVNPVHNSAFGWKVALSGSYAVISSSRVLGGASAPYIDTVYVYEKISGSWTFRTKLVQSDPVSGDGFGSSVGIGGDYIFVGAPYRNQSRGAVYVYERNGLNWNQISILTASSPQAGSRFGATIAMTSIFALIAAPKYVSNGVARGTVYNFSRNISTWSQVQQLWGFPALTDFGVAMDISGSYALIGAPGSDYNGVEDAGVAYFYRQVGQLWTPGDTVYNPNPQIGDQFGFAVTLNQSTNTAFISRPERATSNSNTGEVLKYQIGVQPIGLVNQAVLAHPMAHASIGKHFGHSISMYNDHLLVGLPNIYNDNASDGRVYIYKFDPGYTAVGDQWRPWKMIKDDNEMSTNYVLDTYGLSVYINGTDVVIGNPGIHDFRGKVLFMDLY